MCLSKLSGIGMLNCAQVGLHLVSFHIAAVGGGAAVDNCGLYKAYDSVYDACKGCNFCCNKTLGGHINNLTPESKCIDLKKDSFLYGCFEQDGEDVCPVHMYPIHPTDSVTDSSLWEIVGPIMGILAVAAFILAVCFWQKRQKKAPEKDVTLTDVKIISQPASQKDEETPPEQENLVEAVPATTGHEMSSKVVKTAAEPWGSMEDDNTSVQENEDSSTGSRQNRSARPVAKPWGLGETSRKYVPDDPPELAVGAQPEKPEEEEPLLEDGDQTRVKSLSMDPYYEGLVDEKFNLSAEAKPGASE
ncbi:uncharacterized protein LOC106151668 [Lingula anatina]|uniref:Uncharacterized protein LOC106151668 n=1 Tax=Lingula anatina TaxID=7574 RepID=A0A1S3H4U4_LINAN|nr:uncharacterized protein LOC106151668 [Lingula anatina]|eukprot:XP_013380486.1 uncharacterized protein LOC106151668 [Lingula anatina]